ncbi:NAD(P)/FAD-dependent oxidoreductase [Aeromicrobium chenweiae]|uniref:FAD-dependent oxidoreductase n=1 Tax=Aeromicrobium chenweiae TaxID=2079793 RepID=A0A2S0WJ76_9ACTN|nr:FAD-dependent oxidoreductase [Aeromicrobium chenweiae]AWB91389.1 FAD-dependent oxidoreductase [Aeromicrobium chenweiae]TGN30680.1 FAD-dependent oxidoreductase [Aeromicrobium chenweiae]
MTHRTVIVGAGIAGVSAAAALRSAGYDGAIDLVSDEPGLPYRRPPVSKEIIRGDKTADEIRIKKAEWYEQQGVVLHTGTAVTAIDTDARAVRLSEGEPLLYDHLLLATGGRARSPWDAAGVRTLRGLTDVPRLKNELSVGGPVVVVGAGLIGSEIAASARGLGCDVTLLETASLPLPRLLPTALGEMAADLHKTEGTDLHTDVMVSSIRDEDGTTVVRSIDGRTWSAPVVVVAVGMEPHVELAEAAGISIAPASDGGGIAVDDRGRTSAPGVFAAGDVANQPNGVLGGRHRVEHWQGAQNHGTAVGKVMAGGDDAFVEVPWCWSDQYGVNLQVAGWPEGSHDMEVRGSIAERDFIAYLLDDGIVRGAVSVGRPRDIRTARAWIADQARLDEVLEPEA